MPLSIRKVPYQDHVVQETCTGLSISLWLGTLSALPGWKQFHAGIHTGAQHHAHHLRGIRKSALANQKQVHTQSSLTGHLSRLRAPRRLRAYGNPHCSMKSPGPPQGHFQLPSITNQSPLSFQPSTKSLCPLSLKRPASSPPASSLTVPTLKHLQPISDM